VLAEKGQEWDASAVWWPTDETKEDFLISEPVVNTSFVFFHLKSNSFQWKTFENLQGFKIGFTRGYDYGKEFMTLMNKGNLIVDIANSDEVNYKKLLKGRIFLFPNDPIVGYAQIRNTFSLEETKLFTHHPKEFEKNTLNLIISKKCKNGILFLEKFNAGIRKLKANGTIDQMYKNLEAGKYDKQNK